MAAEVRHRLREMADRDRLDSRERHLRPRLGGAHEPMRAVPPRAFGSDQRTGHRSQPAVERELADGGVPGEAADRDLAGSGDERQRDRQVEARPFLPQVGRREVHDDAVARPVELGRFDPAPHSLLGFLARPVGQADDRELRSAELDVRLDLDPPGLETDESMSDCARDHVVMIDNQSERKVSQLCAGFREGLPYARRATSTSSKYSPARRPVRRFTCRR